MYNIILETKGNIHTKSILHKNINKDLAERICMNKHWLFFDGYKYYNMYIEEA